MMPRITYHEDCWWDEVATRRARGAAQRIYRYFANAPQPHRVVMSRLLCPDCGEREFTVWGELLAIDAKTCGVLHFFN